MSTMIDCFRARCYTPDMLFLRLRNILAFAALLTSVLSMTGCGGGGSHATDPIDDPTGTRAWTVLVYMAADNNLETFGIKDINEMETVGSTSQVTVLVQIDRRAGGDSTNGDWTTTRRYRVTRDSDQSLIGSELLADLGELNMAAPETLTDFVQWGIQNYPAQRYLLVLWDHGAGWQSRTLTAEPREVRAIHVDEASGMDDMSLPELEQAFAPLPRLDIVFFDACLMGMMEVAHSIRGSADVMVASEEEIPADGAPYQSLVGRLAYNPQIGPAELASLMVADYIDFYAKSGMPCTMSALSLAGMGDLSSATDSFAAEMSASLGTTRSAIRLAAEQAQHYDTDSSVYTTYTDYRDLYSFALRVRESVGNTQVRAAASDVMSAIDRVLIAQRNTGGSVADSHGIAIYLPTPSTRTDWLLTRYRGISFARDTRWDEFLAEY